MIKSELTRPPSAARDGSRTASRKARLAFSIRCHRSATCTACGRALPAASPYPPPRSRAMILVLSEGRQTRPGWSSTLDPAAARLQIRWRIDKFRRHGQSSMPTTLSRSEGGRLRRLPNSPRHTPRESSSARDFPLGGKSSSLIPRSRGWH